MRLFLVVAAGASLAATGAAEAQQPKPLEVRPGASFKHRHSKLQLPPALNGVKRGSVLEIEDDQLDVAAQYTSADQAQIYTVYVFRNVAGSLPVWFDRANRTILGRDEYGETTLLERDPAFVPPGQAAASGLLSTYNLKGKALRSTGVAIVPLGEWLVKLRASSATLSAAELEPQMKAALAALEWPRRMPASPAVQPVQDCTTSLALSGEAKPAKDDGAAMLLGALASGIGADRTGSKGSSVRGPEPVWCRDKHEVKGSGVYRADGATNSYLIALADSGRAVSVGPSEGVQVLAQTEPGDVANSWSVSVVQLGRTLRSGVYDRLPPPDQAMQIVQTGRFAWSSPTWGKGRRTISISPDAFE